MFDLYMRGITIDEIVEKSKDSNVTLEVVQKIVSKEKEKFEKECLKNVVENARKGDVRAIDWLSKRGLFESNKT